MVYIVGAGPGDEKLITLRCAELLSIAEVVIYDYLVNKSILHRCKPTAELIYVGKKPHEIRLNQTEINKLLIEKSKTNNVVVRLKSGDPYIFGRGGEEAIALANANVSFEVVPGVTAALAASAFSGIPLTHREVNSTVVFISAHKHGNDFNSDVHWNSIANLGTIVFYMGVKNLSFICQKLILAGKPKNTPVAVVQWASYPHQKIIIGVLDDISNKASENNLQPPAIIIVGKVVDFNRYYTCFFNND